MQPGSHLFKVVEIALIIVVFATAEIHYFRRVMYVGLQRHHYETLCLGQSGRKIAESLNVSKSGVNDFLRAFQECPVLSYPLPEGITNYGIATLVYGKRTVEHSRNLSYEMPDYETVEKEMSSRKNMTPMVLWNRYSKQCRDRGVKFYSYRQFCENYAKWCEENKETLHFNAVIGQKMEVDFAGKAFQMVDHLTGEVMTIVVFVAVLPYSQHIYAEGMVSTKEPQWIAVNNNALQYFGGVPALVVCDNCKQAVIANKDWIDPELNSDYAEWAEYNHTVILPAKVKKPKYKSSVENAVGILEKGFFHDMEEMYRSPKFLELDPLTAIANLVQPEYQKKMNKLIQSRLRSAHLRGCPQELSNCVDSGDREYLPRGITGTLSILDFIDAGMNVCILGPSDSGKSYLAKAIGIVACNTYKVESPPLRDAAGGDGSPQGCGLLQIPEAYEENLRSRPADSG